MKYYSIIIMTLIDNPVEGILIYVDASDALSGNKKKQKTKVTML